MDRTRRRAIWYVFLFTGTLAFFTLSYKFGMAAFEGRSRTLLESLQIVIQTFTTTGYGEDAPWESSQMLLLVVLMQMSAIFLIFLTLPLFIVPWVERRLEYQPSTTFDGEDHVVICGFTEREETLVDELNARDVGHVVLVDDRERARELYESGYTVMMGDSESETVLENASVPAARAVVLDGEDETNASVTLAIREVSKDVRIVSFVTEAELSPYLQLAGVDDVLYPRRLLGRGLADKVTSTMTTQLGETIDIGANLEIIELPLQKDCELDGVSLEESEIRERTGVNVIGAWIGGEFVPNPEPSIELDRNTVLLVSGRQDQLEDAMDLTRTADTRVKKHVLVAGYGDVGQTVHRSVSSPRLSFTILDREEKPGVDVVGDATDASTFLSAGIDSADAVIVTLGTDVTSIFATLVARELNSDVEIICRADDTDNVTKLYAAGADYVLALATVAGRMLAERVLGEDVIAYDTQIDIVRTEAPGFVGQSLSEAAIRDRTGCTVIAVERNGDVETDISPSFVLRSGDQLFVAGSDECIAQFHEVAGVPIAV